MKLLFATATIAAIAAGAQPSANSDALISVTVYNTGYKVDATTTPPTVKACTPSPSDSACVAVAITGDGAEYSEASGDFNCVIHSSGSAPTYDATCGLRKPRWFRFDFSGRVAYNPGIAQPSWATTSAQGETFLNVQHILLYGAYGDQNEYEFTTRMNLAVPSKSGDYGLRFRSQTPLPDTPEAAYAASNTPPNDPYQTALVRVHHCPDTRAGSVAYLSTTTCLPGQKESWYVYPDPQPANPGTTTTLTKVYPSAPVYQVGALISKSSKGVQTIVGQYTAPFFFRIALK